MSDVFDQNAGNDNTSALEALVGEGKKFTDNEALAIGKVKADDFIEQLQKEKQEALDELVKAQKDAGEKHTVADLIKAVRDAQKYSEEGEQTKQPTEEELQEIVRSIVKGDSAEATSNANRDKGNQLVLDKFDGNVEAAQAYVAERAKALDTTVEKLRELSADSPTLFAKTMEIEPSTAPKGTGSLQDKGHNTQNLTPNAVEEIEGHKTKAYYDRMRKEMGVRKFLDSHRLQNQMMADGLVLRERFNN